ncbi:hypothetical protein IQ230_20660 [Gloeocapsopsis crepidinum LEGE 06123]|uniref:Uncharacterized protein n=2 Tax=Gloeocapsopsis crepidinum TaxID=693223 RepID=A0ABR9UXH9_9CHRO|nr:hypothetical protein [Gloeocapsopsis crepidinum]MBE9192718.1 hypothetical protein [Gloeocapsopsis crepidinum LEGE 06123]
MTVMLFKLIPLITALLLPISTVNLSQTITAQFPQTTATVKRSDNLEEDKFKFEQCKFIIETLVVIGGVLLSLYTYRITQGWKRREYLDNKFKEFENSREVNNVRKMLDSDSHFVNLFPDDPMPPNRFNYIEDEEWSNALKDLDAATIKDIVDEIEKFYNKDSYLDRVKQEVKGIHYPRHMDKELRSLAIRDDFNRFLDYLEQFKSMLDANTVNKNDLEKYLINWALIIERVERSYKTILLKYMIGTPTQTTPTQMSVKELFETFYSFRKDPQTETWVGIEVKVNKSQDGLGTWFKKWWKAEEVSKWLKT